MWKEIFSASSDANKAALWKESIDMERRFGNVENTRRLFYMAVNSVTDKPHDIFNAFIQFEREEGTLEELDKALEKVNLQARRLHHNQPQQKKSKKGQQHYQPKKRQQNFDEDENQAVKKQKYSSNNNVIESTQPSEEVDKDGFKKPFLPAPRTAVTTVKKSNGKDTDTGETMEHDGNGTEDNSNAPTSSTFQYSTGVEFNKLFVRNVDFACTEPQLTVIFLRNTKILIP